MYYYWSVDIHKIKIRLSSSTTLWCKLEANSCISTSLLALLTSPLSCNVSSSSLTLNPVIVSTLRIWCQYRQHLKFPSASTLMPILENHLFPPSLTDPVFKQWYAKSLKCFQDLYRDGTFCSYAELSYDLGLTMSHLYRVLQIRHCSAFLFHSYPSLPPVLVWEEFLQFNPHHKSQVSRIYGCLLSLDDCFIDKIKSVGVGTELKF